MYEHHKYFEIIMQVIIDGETVETSGLQDSEKVHNDHRRRNSTHIPSPIPPIVSHHHTSKYGPSSCQNDHQLIPPSSNQAHRIEPSKHEQQEAEAIARDILGVYIRAPTAKTILDLQATLMDPLEWILVRNVIVKHPKAEVDLMYLAFWLQFECYE